MSDTDLVAAPLKTHAVGHTTTRGNVPQTRGVRQRELR